jgi:hypothetical protein
MKLTKDSAQVTGKTFKEWEKSGLHTLADAWNAGLHAALASKPVAGKTDALDMYYRQKDGCKIHGDGHGKICLRCVDEALASKEAEIANWKDISGQAHDVAEELQKELAELRSPGPCGKHPKMFYHTHTDSCYGKIPETEGTGEYLRCRLVAGCTLCAELASAEARIEAAVNVIDGLWRQRISKPNINGCLCDSCRDLRTFLASNRLTALPASGKCVHGRSVIKENGQHWHRDDSSICYGGQTEGKQP